MSDLAGPSAKQCLARTNVQFAGKTTNPACEHDAGHTGPHLAAGRHWQIVNGKVSTWSASKFDR